MSEALAGIIKEGNRASDVIGRIRALIKKAPPRKDVVFINDAILEVVALTRTEAANNGVLVRTQLAEGVPRPAKGQALASPSVTTLSSSNIRDRSRSILNPANLPNSGSYFRAKPPSGKPE